MALSEGILLVLTAQRSHVPSGIGGTEIHFNLRCHDDVWSIFGSNPTAFVNKKGDYRMLGWIFAV